MQVLLKVNQLWNLRLDAGRLNATVCQFSFKSCKFRVQKSKEGTGRVTMWKLGIKNSYTMEASFGGSTLGNIRWLSDLLIVWPASLTTLCVFSSGDRRGTHFSTGDLKSIGYCFCDTLLDYCDPDPSKVRRKMLATWLKPWTQPLI